MSIAIRKLIKKLKIRDKKLQIFYEIGLLTNNVNEVKDAIQILYQKFQDYLEIQSVFFLCDNNSEKLTQTYPKGDFLFKKDIDLLNKYWQEFQESSSRYDKKNLKSSWHFQAMATRNHKIGILAIKIPTKNKFNKESRRLVKFLALHSAAILERLILQNTLYESKISQEREEFRSMLLSSVSHDLKTPLCSIISSLDIYKRMDKKNQLNPEIIKDLIETASTEAERLNSFISNILEMTKIETSFIDLETKWVSSSETIKQIRRNLGHALKNNNLIIENNIGNFEVKIDLMLIKQVLQNVIENAIKYSTPKSDIIISEQLIDGVFAYKVRNYGSKIQEDKKDAIFNKYERLKYSDSKIAGTGLGLAICKSIMESHKGGIYVQNHSDGPEFVIWLSDFRSSS